MRFVAVVACLIVFIYGNDRKANVLIKMAQIGMLRGRAGVDSGGDPT